MPEALVELDVPDEEEDDPVTLGALVTFGAGVEDDEEDVVEEEEEEEEEAVALDDELVVALDAAA